MIALEIGKSKYRMPCPLPTITGKTPKEIDKAAQKCDVVWCVYEPEDYNNRHGLPNKLFLAFKHGKPIVVARGTSTCMVVQYYKCGICIEYGKWKKEDDLRLRNNLKTFAEGSRAAYKNYNWKMDKRTLLYVYQDLGGSKIQ